MRFYSEAVDFTRQLLAGTTTAIKLVAMHDIELRAGEWETIIGIGGMAGGKRKATTQKEAMAAAKQTSKMEEGRSMK
jgi:hypothetical protein